MTDIKCKKGKCWDNDSQKKKIRETCDEDDIVCQTEADLLEKELDD
ncbi:hypothetical protein GF327_00770 [Candidatus Woesearchaeota archaeon]|nr:hypothetical protein [Candidatus Woesearchaeota archaeon]